MANEWEYISGDWWVICDVCGFKYRSSEVKHRWDGLIVCKEDWETRHPLDFIKTRSDKQDVPFSRAPTEETFVTVNYSLGYVNPGYIVNEFDYVLEEFS